MTYPYNYKYSANKPGQPVEHYVFGKRFATYNHAILDSNNRVISIRNYPKEQYTRAIIPIQGRPCALGWTWNGRAFNPPRNQACLDISPYQPSS